MDITTKGQYIESLRKLLKPSVRIPGRWRGRQSKGAAVTQLYPVPPPADTTSKESV